MATTMENLKTAFAGESQANRKYTAFAKKAEKDGFAQVARLFRAAAEAETVHALGHFNAMDAVGSTADNLKAAMAGETYEFTEMYPPMLAQAQAENHKAKVMFDYAAKAERIHAGLYKMALDAVASGKDLPAGDIYVCPVCGNVEFGPPKGNCAVCGAPAGRFAKIG